MCKKCTFLFPINQSSSIHWMSFWPLAMEKAEEECRKWQVNTLSPVEKAYLETVKELGQKVRIKKTK